MSDWDEEYIAHKNAVLNMEYEIENSSDEGADGEHSEYEGPETAAPEPTSMPVHTI